MSKEVGGVGKECGSGFTLIVVLFILLIIVGASYWCDGYGGYGGGYGYC
ncbi:YjcZ family sporulation protein [Sporosarcina thermotolerans]|uniref:YjcZ family sporulation protein n=1 Tax=Sporosarcina thermotolerans TaxID=633404 RepID=A0AAW9AAM4_9BACL|nr:YjcZ family sporulation protein [Sporosarcina thermotolerans]MDW0117653.1 YjcZ family sporulation protein [Sporosarcina thermotolerans]WHT49252.1 YjcZ family sporulation protein [Sporosarcina thermotolerans]